jgi:hypothetical protein
MFSMVCFCCWKVWEEEVSCLAILSALVGNKVENGFASVDVWDDGLSWRTVGHVKRAVFREACM